MKLILASASPRRRALLTAAGLDIDVRPSDIDERPAPGEPPIAYARRVATEKARAAAAAPALAADTVVALDGDILGKPVDAADARRILGRLSGREHRVHTAISLRLAGRIHTRVYTTRVTFRALTAPEIDAYIATGEPFDKAGAYGIQGHGGALVDRVRGSYTNVVGLPLRETLALLRRWGIE